jgi:hypothetical protein
MKPGASCGPQEANELKRSLIQQPQWPSASAGSSVAYTDRYEQRRWLGKPSTHAPAPPLFGPFCARSRWLERCSQPKSAAYIELSLGGLPAARFLPEVLKSHKPRSWGGPGGLYFAAGVSTAVILAILAGVKPLEQMYRDRNQSCRLVVEAAHGSLTPDLVKRTLGVRAGQIKRFVVKPGEAADVDEVTVILTRVASQDTQGFAEKLQSLSNVNQVSIVTRRDDRALLDAL